MTGHSEVIASSAALVPANAHVFIDTVSLGQKVAIRRSDSLSA